MSAVTSIKSDRDPTEIGDKILAEGTHKERSLAMESVKDYGILAIRLIFILNGAAIIAILTLIGTLHTKDSNIVSGYARELSILMTPSLFLYGVGVFCAALTAGIGYLNWSVVVDTYMGPGDLYLFFRDHAPPKMPRWKGVAIESTRVVAIVLFFVGLFSFGGASWFALEAFTTVKVP